MSKESLIKMREFILSLADDNEIDQVDKLELMLNLYKFLDPEYYEKNVKYLSEILIKDKYKEENQNGKFR